MTIAVFSDTIPLLTSVMMQSYSEQDQDLKLPLGN